MPPSLEQPRQRKGVRGQQEQDQVATSNQTLRILAGGTRHPWMAGEPSSARPPLPTTSQRANSLLNQKSLAVSCDKARKDLAIEVPAPGAFALMRATQTAASLPTPLEAHAHADHDPQSQQSPGASVLPSPAPTLNPSPVTSGHVDITASAASSANGSRKLVTLRPQALSQTASRAFVPGYQRHRMPVGPPIGNAAFHSVGGPNSPAPSLNSPNTVYERLQSEQLKRPAPSLEPLPPGSLELRPKRICQAQVSPHSSAATEDGRRLAGWLKQLDTRLAACQGLDSRRQSVERPRYRMLHDACTHGDLFYIIFHQSFCLWTVDKSVMQRIIPLDLPTVDKVFQTMLMLLRRNEDMGGDHLMWFTQFPGKHSSYMEQSKSYTDAFIQVVAFLRNFTQQWDRLGPVITARRYPITAYEARYALNCPSPVLQTIFFTFTRRVLCVKDGPCATQLNHLFLEDQQQEEAMAEQNVPPEVRARLHHDIAHKYSAIIQNQGQLPQPSTPSTPSSVQFPTPAGHEPLAANFPPARKLNAQHSNSPVAPPPPAANLILQTESGPGNGGMISPVSLPTPTQHRHNDHHFPFVTNALSAQSHPHILHSVVQSQQQQMVQQTWIPPGHAQTNQPPSASVYGPMTTYIQQHITSGPSTYPVHTASGAIVTYQSSRSRLNDNPISVLRPSSSNPISTALQGQRSTAETFVPPHIYPMQEAPNSLHPSDATQNGVPYRIPENDFPSNQFDWTSVQPSLHLVRLRSPDRGSSHPDSTRFYQFIFEFARAPTAIYPQTGIVNLDFIVPKKYMTLLPVTRVRSSTQLPMAHYSNESVRYRLRLCHFKAGQQLSKDAWVVMPNSWPEHIYITVNGEPHLPRRRQHFHNDLPIELTESVHLGENTVAVSLPKVSANLKKGGISYVAVEVIKTIDHKTTKSLVMQAPHVSFGETKCEIERRLRASEEDDIIVENDALIISLADPFSSVIYDIPIRGIHCRHLECFDLETWLRTRPCKPSRHEKGRISKEPCMVDVWKCPICGLDARPPNLRVDDYFTEIRATLFARGQERVKKVQVDPKGNWTPVIEDDDSDDSVSNADDASAHTLLRPSTKRPTTEVIEILDD